MGGRSCAPDKCVHRRSGGCSTWSLLATLCMCLARGCLAAAPAKAKGPMPGCLIFQLSTYGFASHINNIVEGAVMTTDITNYYVNDTKFMYRCHETDAWESLFRSQYPKVWPRGKKEMRTADGKPCASIDPAFTHGISAVIPDRGEAFDRIGQALLGIWQFEKGTEDYIARHQTWVDLLPRPLLAVHVRGGDKAEEDRKFRWRGVHPPDYMLAMKKAFPNLLNAGGTCLFIGDDYYDLAQVASSVQEWTRCIIMMEVPPQYGGDGGHDQSLFNEKAPKCAMTRLLISQIEAMARADYFLGGYTSNVSRLTQLLRVHKYNKTRSSGADVLLRPWSPTPFMDPIYQVEVFQTTGRERVIKRIIKPTTFL